MTGQLIIKTRVHEITKRRIRQTVLRLIKRALSVQISCSMLVKLLKLTVIGICLAMFELSYTLGYTCLSQGDLVGIYPNYFTVFYSLPALGCIKGSETD